MSKKIIWHDREGKQHETELSYRLFPTSYKFDLGVCPHCGGDADVISGIDDDDPDDFMRCLSKNCRGYRPDEEEE